MISLSIWIIYMLENIYWIYPSDEILVKHKSNYLACSASFELLKWSIQFDLESISEMIENNR